MSILLHNRTKPKPKSATAERLEKAASLGALPPSDLKSNMYIAAWAEGFSDFLKGRSDRSPYGFAGQRHIVEQHRCWQRGYQAAYEVAAKAAESIMTNLTGGVAGGE